MKKYRSANGKLIDIDGLRLANEDAIAVGNMRVNARGDELGPGGKVVKTRNDRMNENYKLHTMIPKDDVVHADALEADISNGTRKQRVEQVKDIIKNKDLQDNVDKPTDENGHSASTTEESIPKKVDFTQLGKEETPVAPRRGRGKLADTVSNTQPVQKNESTKPTKTIRRI